MNKLLYCYRNLAHQTDNYTAQIPKSKFFSHIKTILFNLCGHGNFDMKAYEDYFAGNIGIHELTTEEITASLAELDTPEIA